MTVIASLIFLVNPLLCILLLYFSIVNAKDISEPNRFKFRLLRRYWKETIVSTDRQEDMSLSCDEDRGQYSTRGNPTAKLRSFIPFFFVLSRPNSFCLQGKQSLRKWYNRNKITILACILCSIFVSLINMVKIPENDLVWYLESYKKAGEFSLWHFMLVGSDANMVESFKEPIYGAIVWLMHHLLCGNEFLFKFLLSLINYLFLTFSVVLFSKKLNIFPLWCIITGIYLMCFIPWIFTMSMQLLRQFLASSILVFLLVRTSFYNKRDYLLIIVMVLIHSTAWLYVPFLLLPAFNKPFEKSRIWYVASIIGILSIKILAKVVGSSGLFASSSLSYAIDRASSNTTFELGELSWIKILMIVIILVYSLYLPNISRFRKIKGIHRFCFTLTVLCVFILVNMNEQELANRFLFYLFPFVPFLLMFLISELKINKLLVSLFTLSIIVFFSIFLSIGTWKYDFYGSVWINPVFVYFLKL